MCIHIYIYTWVHIPIYIYIIAINKICKNKCIHMVIYYILWILCIQNTFRPSGLQISYQLEPHDPSDAAVMRPVRNVSRSPAPLVSTPETAAAVEFGSSQDETRAKPGQSRGFSAGWSSNTLNTTNNLAQLGNKILNILKIGTKKIQKVCFKHDSTFSISIT